MASDHETTEAGRDGGNAQLWLQESWNGGNAATFLQESSNKAREAVVWKAALSKAALEKHRAPQRGKRVWGTETDPLAPR